MEMEQELLKGVVPNLKPIHFDECFENWIKLFKTKINSNTLAR